MLFICRVYVEITSSSVPDAELARITLEILGTCLVVAPALSSPHKDGWRSEHLSHLASDDECGEALAPFATSIIVGDVSDKISNLLSSATLVVLLKKDADTMVAMKQA